MVVHAGHLTSLATWDAFKLPDMDRNAQHESYFVTLKDFLENQARLEAEQKDLDQKKILNELGRRNFDELIRNLRYRQANGEDISYVNEFWATLVDSQSPRQELMSLQAVPNARAGYGSSVFRNSERTSNHSLGLCKSACPLFLNELFKLPPFLLRAAGWMSRMQYVHRHTF